MALTREIAVELAQAGILTIEQKKKRISHADWARDGFRGIVRLRLCHKGSNEGVQQQHQSFAPDVQPVAKRQKRAVAPRTTTPQNEK